MFDKINLDYEHKFIIDLLLNNKTPEKKILNRINYDKLIKLTSRNLIVPLTYYYLHHKNLIEQVDKEFANFIKEIFLINKGRNRKLINESKEIGKLLKKNKIDYVFIKGAAHILSEIYPDIGVRMVGDIDFLIKPKDKEKFIKIFLKKGYQYVSKSKDILSDTRHIPRMIKPNKLFAIEAHTKLTDRKSLNNYSNDYINNLNILNGVAVPIFKNQILHNIYNFEINDYGGVYMNYSLKNYYDHIAINNFCNDKINIADIHTRNFYMKGNLLGIENLNNNSKIINLNQIRFYLINTSKVYKNIDYLIAYFLKRIGEVPRRVYEFCINPNYRKYILNKINIIGLTRD